MHAAGPDSWAGGAAGFSHDAPPDAAHEMCFCHVGDTVGSSRPVGEGTHQGSVWAALVRRARGSSIETVLRTPVSAHLGQSARMCSRVTGVFAPRWGVLMADVTDPLPADRSGIDE